MKILTIVTSILISSYGLSADEDPMKGVEAYLEEVNRTVPIIYEATQGKSLLEQITIYGEFTLEYINNPVIGDFLLQEMGRVYSVSGQHEKALEAFDKHSYSNERLIEEIKTLNTKNAIETILEISKARQIVMINEAHHVSQHRVLTYELLAELWDQGFRYFAAETFSEYVVETLSNDYVTLNTGTYTKEPAFSNLVLHAKRLGFELIPYDLNAGGLSTDDRERNAAKQIEQRIFDLNPNAKVVIHVGYAHISEESWLASYLKKNLNLDPLTIDQTSLAEKSAPRYEPETYTWIVNNLEFEDPIVFVEEDESIWSIDKGKYDMTVVWPRTYYEFGRAQWEGLGRDQMPINNEWCETSYPCMVEVFQFNNDDEIPMDRTVITSASEMSSVFISEGINVLVVKDAEGRQLYTQTINH